AAMDLAATLAEMAPAVILAAMDQAAISVDATAQADMEIVKVVLPVDSVTATAVSTMQPVGLVSVIAETMDLLAAMVRSVGTDLRHVPLRVAGGNHTTFLHPPPIFNRSM
ncbi:hypothetical protein H310_15149, partial [Aphanomyces invadans]